MFDATIDARRRHAERDLAHRTVARLARTIGRRTEPHVQPSTFHLQATVLPFGDGPTELWIDGGRIRTTPLDGAEALAPRGGFVLPGLVDAHVHLVGNRYRTGLRVGSRRIRQVIPVRPGHPMGSGWPLVRTGRVHPDYGAYRLRADNPSP